MRQIALLLLAILALAAASLPGEHPGTGRAENPPYQAVVPALARDEPQPLQEWLVEATCFQAPGYDYTVAGYEVVQAPRDFFYAHAFATDMTEPFTHTGSLELLLQGPGAFSEMAAAPIEAGAGEAWFKAPGSEGIFPPGDFAVSLPNGILAPGSSATFTIPTDCTPLALGDFIAAPFPRVLQLQASASGGTCSGFTTTLQITLEADGQAQFFQPDTGDLNTGRFWPAGPPGSAFEIFVFNADEPEAYFGTLSSNLQTFKGGAVWKNQCAWAIEAVQTY